MSEYKNKLDSLMESSKLIGELGLKAKILAFVSDQIDRAELQGEAPNYKRIVERVLEML